MRSPLESCALLRPRLSRTDFPREKRRMARPDMTEITKDFRQTTSHRALTCRGRGEWIEPPGREEVIGEPSDVHAQSLRHERRQETLPLLIDRPRGPWASPEGGFTPRQGGKVKQARVLHAT
ncbi:hypothetical protein MRX96_031428 [Rhipicephalus microplus]